jgi:hypothetical protein
MCALRDRTRVPLTLEGGGLAAARSQGIFSLAWRLWELILEWLSCWLGLWRRLVGFVMQTQLQTQWCWAACSASVSTFFDGASTWTQCGIVNAELGQSTCCQDGSTAQCNQPWYLDLALQRTGNLASWAAGTVTLAQVRSEVRRRRPVGARIGWSGGGGHFVMIAGYRCRDGGWLDIRDPIFGASDVPLAIFTSSYQGTGSWTHTYYTEP